MGVIEDEELLLLVLELEWDWGVGKELEIVDIGGGWFLLIVWVSFYKWWNDFDIGYLVYFLLFFGRKIELVLSYFFID